MATTITLRNDFHNTSVTIEPKGGRLSRSQWNRVAATLCGNSTCTCGVVRGPQDKGVAEVIEATDIALASE